MKDGSGRLTDNLLFLHPFSGSFPMKRGPVVGIIFALLVTVGTVVASTSNYIAFIHFQGFVVVFGGAIACAFLSHPSEEVMKAFKALREIGADPDSAEEDLGNFLEKVIGWAYLVQSKGFLGLEQAGEKEEISKDPLLRYGLELTVTGYEPQEVQKMVETAADSNYRRNIFPAKVLHTMASSSPAFGMVGTLIGMIVMLGSLQSDVSQVASGLSVALLATLYGLLSARLLYLPAQEKLLLREDRVRVRYYLMAEGLAMLLGQKNPHAIQDRLNSYIDPSSHYDLNKTSATLKRKYGLTT
jgi:chemotaxis protein MotA